MKSARNLNAAKDYNFDGFFL